MMCTIFSGQSADHDDDGEHRGQKVGVCTACHRRRRRRRQSSPPWTCVESLWRRPTTPQKKCVGNKGRKNAFLDLIEITYRFNSFFCVFLVAHISRSSKPKLGNITVRIAILRAKLGRIDMISDRRVVCRRRGSRGQRLTRIASSPRGK